MTELPSRTTSIPDQGPGAGLPPQAAAPSHPDPPSVRAVLAALQPAKRLTGAELRVASGLPRRTVYQALRILRRRGAVQQRASLHDSRQSYYWLAGPAPAPATLQAPSVAAQGFQGAAPARPSVSVP